MELGAWAMYLGICLVVYAVVCLVERAYIALMDWIDGW